MSSPLSASIQQCEIEVDQDPIAVCHALRATQATSLLLDGSGGFGSAGWSTGPLLAIAPTATEVGRGQSGAAALSALERALRQRRVRGGGPQTGLAVLLAYDALGDDDPAAPRDAHQDLPGMVVVAVDRSLCFPGPGRALLTLRRDADHGAADLNLERDRLLDAVAQSPAWPEPARGVGLARTSLPRDMYLQALGRVKRHIALGDIYQANLSQQLQVDYAGDELALYRALSRSTPAPRSAFLETNGLTLASVSPETFVRVELPGVIRTWPIKGTRPRGETAEEDRRAAQELLDSPKDRAELLMIVDLERNDLGKICRTGSVVTHELARLQSFAAVHHLVASIEGRLRQEVDIAELIGAVFPGGSITGAPKRRAIQILNDLEPAWRNYFTGSLFWFGDDGQMDSSILIRSVVLSGGRARIGAGGGIVADSEPEEEWLESNHKARALTSALGFDPEEAR